VLFISGCSTKFVYKNIDWLAYWYLDDFVELTDEQKVVFDQKLNEWLVWHKENELPQYVGHIAEISNDVVTQQLSLDKIQYHQDKAQAHWRRLRAHIVPDAVEMSPMLNEEQITYLFAALEKRNKEREDEIQERNEQDPEKRAKKRLKNSLKDAQTWLGKLTKEQERLIENTLPQFYSNSPLWLEYNRTYQNELRMLFARSDRGDEFKTALQDLLLNPEQFRSEALVTRNKSNSEVYKNMLLTLMVLSTEKQRNHFVEEAGEYKQDFIDLTE
jgi:hypothetical protein